MAAMVSRVLLLDAAFAAVPIHDFLVASGWEVWTMGNRSGDPLALANPDRWIEGDYSDVDSVVSAIAAHAFDAIVPGCTDVSMATFVATGFEGPYRYTAHADAILNTKNLFRQLCADLELPSPRTATCENLPPRGRFICKPVDSFSGKGVSIFNAEDSAAARDAFKTARGQSRTGQVICEEYIEGQLYSYSSFLKDGQVEIAFVVREGSRYDPFSVDTSHVVDWQSNPNVAILKSSVERIAQNLALCDGLIHVQFILNSARLVLLEITRRCPGDLYSLLVEYSTGFPYAAKYASYFIGKAIAGWAPERRHILRHTVKQMGGGRFDGLDIDIDLNIRRVIPVRRTGDHITGTGFQRTGLIFAQEESQECLWSKYEIIVGAMPKTDRSGDRGGAC